jgi:hypothetical protein
MAATETGRQTSPKDLGRYIGEAKPKRLDELPSFSHRRHCRDAGRDSFIGFPPGCLMLDCNWSKKDLAFVQHLPWSKNLTNGRRSKGWGLPSKPFEGPLPLPLDTIITADLESLQSKGGPQTPFMVEWYGLKEGKPIGQTYDMK